jgi:glycosyltransferase involved in cell wall biosynthesis
MKPRLLFIVGRFVIGGHASDNIPLLFHLKHHYISQIIHGEKEADEIEPFFLLEKYPGLDIIKLPSLKRSINPFSDLITVFSLYKKIKAFKPDIVHTHGAKAGVLGRIAAWFYGRTLIVHTFHGHLFHSYFGSITTGAIIVLERLLAKITNASIALSLSQKKELVEKYRIYPCYKVHEIPLGLFSPPEPTFRKRNFKQQHNLKNDTVLIGIIGRIVSIKNQIDFLHAARIILSCEKSNIKFAVIGDGEDRQLLTNFLTRNNISFSIPENPIDNADVIFTSWIDDIYQAIYDLDIVVLTSLNEGTPVSLIEAQLCAKPVVAYDVGGVKDTFLDKVSGFLVRKGDFSALATLIIQLAVNEDERKLMGERGREYAAEKFSKQTELRSIDKLYKELLQKKF